MQHFYVDDFVAGTNKLEEAVHLRQQLCDLLQKAQMTLRKWRSSSTEFRKAIPEELVEVQYLQLASQQESLKALGVHWNVQQDNLYVAVPNVPTEQIVTKRNISSVIGKVFDIMGFFAPVTITAKLLLRKLWQLGISWDTSAPSSISDAWTEWTSQLGSIGAHSVPRKYNLQLHGFSDTSNQAYGAVIYIRQVFVDDSISTSIVLAKARVLPVKGMTIPRAELTAAHLLAKLLKYVSHQLHMSDITAWSDSAIVLCWLRRSPTSLNSFVANRVRIINNLVPEAKCHHISTDQNPADLLSRGTTIDVLIRSHLWWAGPHWFAQPSQTWPPPHFRVPETLPETKAVVMIAPSEKISSFWDKYSSFNHLCRIYTWIRRFINNWKYNDNKRMDKCLQTN